MYIFGFILIVFLYIIIGMVVIEHAQSDIRFWTLPTVVKIYRLNSRVNFALLILLVWPLIVIDFIRIRK